MFHSLLAHAGFDARVAIQFWESRQKDPKAAECAVTHAEQPKDPNLARRIMGSTHPFHDIRVDKLKDELVRWELERRVAVTRLRNGAENPS